MPWMVTDLEANETYKNFLKQFPQYTDDVYEKALPYFMERHRVKGEYLLKEGHISNEVAYIKTGLLRIFYIKEGVEIATCFCKENTISCSYKSLILQEPSDLSIQAIEDCELMVIKYSDLQKLYSEYPF